MDTMSLSDPFVVLYSKHVEGGREIKTELGRTEVIADTLNPQFVKQFVLDYHFETVQNVCFDIYDQDDPSPDLRKHDFIGSVDITLGKLVGKRGRLITEIKHNLSVSKKPLLLLSAEQVQSCADVLHLNLHAKSLPTKGWFGSYPNASIYLSRRESDGSFSVCWKSEVHNNINVKFHPMAIPMQVLCNGDRSRPVLIQCVDWTSSGEAKVIGECGTTVGDLLGATGKDMILSPARGKSGGPGSCGIVSVLGARLEERFTMFDYIKGGLQINLSIAIDFTASNGDPNFTNSLHYRNAHTMNSYQMAIIKIGEILQEYDTDKRFPLFGFGGFMLPPINQVSHCFPLNRNPHDPEVLGIQGVLDAYNNTFRYASLAGPTMFSPFLGAMNARIRHSLSTATMQYNVLLIITDGVINDMDESVDRIIDLSTLPVSIIIIGVGNADFSSMNFLDSDDRVLVGYNGTRSAARDIVQFVPFNAFSHNPSLLAAETLKEMPDQITSYFGSRNIRPLTPAETTPVYPGYTMTPSMRAIPVDLDHVDVGASFRMPSHSAGAPPPY